MTNSQNIRNIQIWNTHYQGIGNNWRVEITFVNGHRVYSETLTMAEVRAFIVEHSPKTRRPV